MRQLWQSPLISMLHPLRYQISPSHITPSAWPVLVELLLKSDAKEPFLPQFWYSLLHTCPFCNAECSALSSMR